jgi:hypothetical protein
MRISNTVYLLYPFNTTKSVHVALAKDDYHSYEHLNVPTAGYQPVKCENNVIYLKHPTLEFQAEMSVSEFVNISLHRHCSEALLVFTDDSRLMEYQPNHMTIEVRATPQQYEQRYVKKIDEQGHRSQELQPIRFVQHINYTSLKATIISLHRGRVDKETVPLNELLSSWEIVPTPLRAEIYNTLPQCIKLSSKHSIDFWRINSNVSFDQEHGVIFHNKLRIRDSRINQHFKISGLGSFLADAIATNRPLLSYSSRNLHTEEHSELESLVFGTIYRTELPVYIAHSSLLAKHWDNLPIDCNVVWQKTAQEAAQTLLEPEYKTAVGRMLYSGVGTPIELYPLIKIQNQVWPASLKLMSHINEDGVFGVLREVKIQASHRITSLTQQTILDHLNALRLPNEVLISQLEVKATQDVFSVWMKSFVPCAVSVEGVSTVQKAVLNALNAAIAFTIEGASLPLYKKGVKLPEWIPAPLILFSDMAAKYYPGIKKQLLDSTS